MASTVIGTEPAHFGAVEKARTFKVTSGASVHCASVPGGKEKLLKRGESFSTAKDVWLRSKGESVVSISTKERGGRGDRRKS